MPVGWELLLAVRKWIQGAIRRFTDSDIVGFTRVRRHRELFISRRKLRISLLAALATCVGTEVPITAAQGSVSERVLFSFDLTDGRNPSAVLIADAQGNFYGTTYGGGVKGAGCGESRCGTVFKLMRGKDGRWTETVLRAFNKNEGGRALPLSSLVMDAKGNLYGTTSEGGPRNGGSYGIVFKLTPGRHSKWILKAIHRFNGHDGGNPGPDLIFDAAGNLYGAAAEGGGQGNGCGSLGCGVVFKLSPAAGSDGWTETVLHRFGGSRSDGAVPYTGLIFDVQGNLYGTTWGGGGYDNGSIFKLTPTADGKWKETLLYSFNSKDGSGPSSALTFDTSGNLYGTTGEGGAHNFGIVYTLTQGTDGKWTETVIHDFHFDDGANPSGRLIFDAAGRIYGTTGHGGIAGGYCGGCGTVYRMTKTSDGRWTESVLYAFKSTGGDAAAPNAGVFRAKSGKLYGTAVAGGEYLYGAVFEITP